MMQLTPGAATAPRRERRLPGGGEEEDAPSEPLFQNPPHPPTPPLIPPPWERLCPSSPPPRPPLPLLTPIFFFGMPSVRQLSQVTLRITAPSQLGESCKIPKSHFLHVSAKKKVFARRGCRTCRCPAPPRVSHPGSGLRRSSLCLAPPTYIMSRETQARRERFSPHKNKSQNESINSEFMQQSCNSSLNQAAQSF